MLRTLPGLIVDGFAGGGGASYGIRLALGRDPDIAVNHDDDAIAMHEANHPTTRHYLSDIWEVDPKDVCDGEPVSLMWASPDCTHHSKAKGSKPRLGKIRALAWVIVRWANDVAPDVILVENVEEFLGWGPLDRRTGQPRPDMKGHTFRRWVQRMAQAGYTMSHRQLRACDFGAATSRKRLYVQFRRDGKAHAWPEATHGNAKQRAVDPSLLPYRTAGECVDWTDTGSSIFEREAQCLAPLAESTLRRIGAGLQKYVLGKRKPYVVTDRVAPFLVHVSNGERPGQAPRCYDLENPLGTVVAQGNKHLLVCAFLAKHYGGHVTPGSSLADPLGTVTCQDHHHLVCAFLIKYFGTATASACDDPLGTLTTKERYALCLVELDGETYRVVDIRTRMLKPRELARAQGFPDSYVLDPVIGYVGKGKHRRPKRLGSTGQVRMIGNSVVTLMAQRIVEAATGIRQEVDIGAVCA